MASLKWGLSWRASFCYIFVQNRLNLPQQKWRQLGSVSLAERKGSCPVCMKKRRTPRENISERSSQCILFIISGAAYLMSPRHSAFFFPASPKSVNSTPYDSENSTFYGLMSLWSTPCADRYLRVVSRLIAINLQAYQLRNPILLTSQSRSPLVSQGMTNIFRDVPQNCVSGRASWIEVIPFHWSCWSRLTSFLKDLTNLLPQ